MHRQRRVGAGPRPQPSGSRGSPGLLRRCDGGCACACAGADGLRPLRSRRTATGAVRDPPPFPRWVMTETALSSVGGLLRRLHDASAAIAEWPRSLADPEGGTMLCHNDVCPENVVFRDGRAAALIDFDRAAPGRAVWDVAMTARYWVPMLDPVSAAAHFPAGSDAPSRLRILADRIEGWLTAHREVFTAALLD
ncbi:aminoglycoside phosphotransferase family protein [Streptomyces sp. HUAS 31]|uniref:aminoglycoside phosphotransferase family protein n=1 Tax=Streptomyces sp. HUAS 31 TaxID=3020055 RepID=UPI003FA7AA10